MNFLGKSLLLTSLALLQLCSGTAATLYVNASAAGSNNGSSWTNAYTDLQTALSLAIIGDEIWVANGVYYPSTTDNRDHSFVMKNGIDIYGGFNGTESSVAERDLSAAATNLSGDIGQPGDNTDNSKKIVSIQNFTADFIFDGFRVVNGYDSGGSGKGAAIYMDNNPGSYVQIRNCLFYNNFAYHSGGALWIRDCDVRFSDCEFLYNSTFNYGGGAIYSANGGDSYIDIQDCKFTGNDARNGTVINFSGYELLMDRCLISNNTATTGNIIDINGSSDLFTISNSVVVGNLLTHYDGSIISSYNSGTDACNLINTTICHNINTATLGPYAATIWKVNGPLNAYNCIIYGNTDNDDDVQIHSDENVSHSIIEHGLTTGTAIIDAAPNFVNPGSLEDAPFDATNLDYSLAEGSVGINSGSNPLVTDYSLDFNRMARVQQATVDIGAIESNHIDTTVPLAQCQDVLLSLGVDGTASLSPDMVDNGSFDLGGIASMTLDTDFFDCNLIGTHIVTLEVTDNSGLTSTCTANVTVSDDLGPTPVLEGVDLYLGADNSATLNVNDIDNGSFDNCGSVQVLLLEDQFDCSDLGPQMLDVELTDDYGNLTVSQVEIVVIDSIAPIALAQSLDLYLDADGMVSVSPDDVDNGSSDNCGLSNYSLDMDTWSCEDIGAQELTLSVIDLQGNLSSVATDVMVHDTISPMVVGQDITVDLQVSQPYVITAADIDLGSSDNCSISLSLDQDSFDMIGDYPVTLTATDVSGNITSQVFMVTVVNSVGLIEWSSAEVQISPNPAQGYCTLQGRLPAAGHIDIYDSQARLLSRILVNEAQREDLRIDLRGLSSGSYSLQLVSTEGTFTLGRILKTDR